MHHWHVRLNAGKYDRIQLISFSFFCPYSISLQNVPPISNERKVQPYVLWTFQDESVANRRYSTRRMKCFSFFAARGAVDVLGHCWVRSHYTVQPSVFFPKDMFGQVIRFIFSTRHDASGQCLCHCFHPCGEYSFVRKITVWHQLRQFTAKRDLNITGIGQQSCWCEDPT